MLMNDDMLQLRLLHKSKILNKLFYYCVVIRENCREFSCNLGNFQSSRNMNSHHLETGDALPPLKPGSLRIYSMRFCPYAQRALLAAAAKGIEYDVVNINLIKKPEWIFEKNPEGKVPTTETNDGRILYESLIVSEFMDDAYGSPSGGDASSRKLHPQDPFQKAMDRIWLQKFGKIESIDFQLYMKQDLTKDQLKSVIVELNQQLVIMEEELKRRGTKFFGGNKPGMLDLMIWPWMERIPCLNIIHANEAELISLLQVGRASVPEVVRWHQDMTEDDAVKPSYLSPETHAQYRQMRRSGKPLNYDFLWDKN